MIEFPLLKIQAESQLLEPGNKVQVDHTHPHAGLNRKTKLLSISQFRDQISGLLSESGVGEGLQQGMWEGFGVRMRSVIARAQRWASTPVLFSIPANNSLVLRRHQHSILQI